MFWVKIVFLYLGLLCILTVTLMPFSFSRTPPSPWLVIWVFPVAPAAVVTGLILGHVKVRLDRRKNITQPTPHNDEA